VTVIRNSAAVAAAAWIAACVPTPPLTTGDSTSSGSTSTGSASTSGTSSDATGGAAQTPACADYLVCLEAIAPDEVPDATLELGPDGTCWQDVSIAAACDAECAAQLDQRCASDSSSSGDTGEVLPICAIESLVPGASSPIEAGTDVGVLPLEIGDLLARNCGCHFVDPGDLAREVPEYNGSIALATWTDFHTPFNGTLTWQRVRQRAVVELSMPVPFYCGTQGLGSLSNEDHALLDAWLTAEAPDGASWP
jgi:hypothetical protein